MPGSARTGTDELLTLIADFSPTVPTALTPRTPLYVGIRPCVDPENGANGKVHHLDDTEIARRHYTLIG